MLLLTLTALITIGIAAYFWGWISGLIVAVTGTVAFFVVVLVASRQSDKKAAQASRDLSDEAARIAALHGMFVEGISASDAYAEQGRRLYESYRMKGLTSDESIDALKEHYERELDEFEHKKTAEITNR